MTVIVRQPVASLFCELHRQKRNLENREKQRKRFKRKIRYLKAESYKFTGSDAYERKKGRIRRDESNQTSIKTKPGSVGVAFAASVGVALLSISITSGQNPSPALASTVAEVEPVIVTGSNIPTAEEVGPNPVDTYRPSDIEKLGVRNPTDLLIKLPQEMGTAVNQNWSGFSDGSVIPNLRGLLPKETLVLIDGKRAAIAGRRRCF